MGAKRKHRGSPALKMAQPMPDTPENVARMLTTTPPRAESEWEYLKEHRRETTALNSGQP